MKKKKSMEILVNKWLNVHRVALLRMENGSSNSVIANCLAEQVADVYHLKSTCSSKHNVLC